jgi:prepilin-type N-terminal cleavage/methylation domain-containing protein
MKCVYKKPHSLLSKGFTLIELLVVIAIVGILAAAVIFMMDPIDKIRSARDTKVIADVRAIYGAAQRVYTQKLEWPDSIDTIVNEYREIKTVPVPPSDYEDYYYGPNSIEPESVSDWIVYGEVKSKVNKKKTDNPDTDKAYFLITGEKGCFLSDEPSLDTTCPDIDATP